MTAIKSLGTDHEIGLKKNDERILFVANDTLVRSESLNQESKVKSIIKEVNQSCTIQPLEAVLFR